MANVNFWFSFFSLLIPLSGGFYFLYKWVTTRQNNKFLLFFGLSLLAIHLYKLPNVLINAGYVIPEYILSPYFFVTLLLYSLGYYLLTRGFLSFARSPSGVVNRIFLVMAIFLMIYYFIVFFVSKISVPVWPGHIFFFIPAQFTALTVYYKTISRNARLSNLGKPNFFILLSLYLLFTTSISYIYTQTGSASNSLWYVFVTLSWGISVLQILAYLSLFLGLYFLTRENPVTKGKR